MNEQQLYPVDTIAKLLDLTPRRIQQLVTAGYIPRAERGRYDLLRSVRGYIHFLREQAAASPTGPEEREARARRTTAMARLAELELAREERTVAPIAEMEAIMRAICDVVRTNVLAVPSRLASQLPPDIRARVFELATEEIRRSLTTIASTEFTFAEPAK